MSRSRPSDSRGLSPLIHAQQAHFLHNCHPPVHRSYTTNPARYFHSTLPARLPSPPTPTISNHNHSFTAPVVVRTLYLQWTLLHIRSEPICCCYSPQLTSGSASSLSPCLLDVLAITSSSPHQHPFTSHPAYLITTSTTPSPILPQLLLNPPSLPPGALVAVRSGDKRPTVFFVKR